MPTVAVAGTLYPIAGASLAVIANDKVLVQLRPFPPGWELPGGHLAQGESPDDCAIRETLEECGLTVRIHGLVGVYQWQGLRTAGDAVYWGTIDKGSPRRSLESWATRWVSSDTTPLTLFPWCHERIADALAASHGAKPVFRTQTVSFQHVGFFILAWLRSVGALATRHK